MPRRVTVDLTVLRESRDLRLVVIGEGISGLGTQAALVAIPFQIYVLTHSAALVGLLGVVERVRLITARCSAARPPPASTGGACCCSRRSWWPPCAATLAATTLLGPPSVLGRVPAGRRAGGRRRRSTTSTRTAVVPALARAGAVTGGAVDLVRPATRCARWSGPGSGGLLIAAWGIGTAYVVLLTGFLVTIVITVPPEADAAAARRRAPRAAFDRRGPEVRSAQQRARRVVRHRPRGDDVRDAARAVRRALPDASTTRGRRARACSTRRSRRARPWRR